MHDYYWITSWLACKLEAWYLAWQKRRALKRFIASHPDVDFPAHMHGATFKYYDPETGNIEECTPPAK